VQLGWLPSMHHLSHKGFWKKFLNVGIFGYRIFRVVIAGKRRLLRSTLAGVQGGSTLQCRPWHTCSSTRENNRGSGLGEQARPAGSGTMQQTAQPRARTGTRRLGWPAGKGAAGLSANDTRPRLQPTAEASASSGPIRPGCA
jgi:hypothetical protein